MQLSYIVITNPEIAPKFLNAYSEVIQALRAATVYVSEYPGDTAHVYTWYRGVTAKQVVEVETIWSAPELPDPVELPEAIIPKVQSIANNGDIGASV